MKKELGLMIRKYREKRELEREELARRLKITVAYVGHLENEAQAARFSEGLMTRVVKVLRLPKRKVLALASAHNRRVKKYRAQFTPKTS